MSKGEIIDFVVLRIQNELDKYNRTKTIPHTILEGTYDINEINEHYLHKLPKRYQTIAKRLLKEYHKQVEKNIESLTNALRRDYSRCIENLSTQSESFRFGHLETRYRKDINPVKALYYETREIQRRFDPTNEHHVWVKSLVTDFAYNNIILDALTKDIKTLERIVKRYYYPITKTESVPLELFHAKLMIKDFRYYYTVFEDIRTWEPE